MLPESFAIWVRVNRRGMLLDVLSEAEEGVNGPTRAFFLDGD
jgi:hypothetical protein